MPTVVTYWQLPYDERDFLAFVESTGPVVAVPTHWAKGSEEFIPEPLSAFIQRHDPDQLLLGLEGHVQAAVQAREIDGTLVFGVPHMKSCVVSYGRGRLRGGKLAQSNLSAYSQYPSQDASQLLDKDQEFVTWAKKVLNWVRKATPERVECNGYPYRATKRVADAVREGKVEVVLY
jgi:hypothetical protein